VTSPKAEMSVTGTGEVILTRGVKLLACPKRLNTTRSLYSPCLPSETCFQLDQVCPPSFEYWNWSCGSIASTEPDGRPMPVSMSRVAEGIEKRLLRW
jgi:hypothetical protein